MHVGSPNRFSSSSGGSLNEPTDSNFIHPSQLDTALSRHGPDLPYISETALTSVEPLLIYVSVTEIRTGLSDLCLYLWKHLILCPISLVIIPLLTAFEETVWHFLVFVCSLKLVFPLRNVIPSSPNLHGHFPVLFASLTISTAVPVANSWRK